MRRMAKRSRIRTVVFCCAASALAIAACGPSSSPDIEGGDDFPDATSPEAGVGTDGASPHPDGAAPDASASAEAGGPYDAQSTGDANPADAGNVDASSTDAGSEDSGSEDGQAPDTGADAGVVDAGTDAPSNDAGACGVCNAGQVCCSAPLGCAGMCVGDCRMGGPCPSGLVCNGASGVCTPPALLDAGSDAGTSIDSGGADSGSGADASTASDGGTVSDAGSSTDAGSGSDASTTTDAGPTYDAGLGDASAIDGGTCTLTQDTYATSTVNAAGCPVLALDNSACAASRIAQGLSGYWLEFSCRITLTVSGTGNNAIVSASFDGQPDYKSNYFPTSNACWESYTGAIQNPNVIAVNNYQVQFPLHTDMTPRPMQGTAVVGMAVNAIPIFGDFAAPGDDIYQEAQTFDRCGGHPNGMGAYHYHSEPYAITNDDSRFVGMMRDGYPIYGRRDANGTYPTLDSYGGHTGTTPDSPSTSVYHYHVNQQTSTNPGTAGQKQWFLTTGTFRGTPASCSGC